MNKIKARAKNLANNANKINPRNAKLFKTNVLRAYEIQKKHGSGKNRGNRQRIKLGFF